MDSFVQDPLRLLAVLWIIATLIPLWHHDGWWVRAFDFPRVQILLSGLALAGIYLVLGAAKGTLGWTLWLALGASLAVPAMRILPYMPWLAADVATAMIPRPGAGLSLRRPLRSTTAHVRLWR